MTLVGYLQPMNVKVIVAKDPNEALADIVDRVAGRIDDECDGLGLDLVIRR